MVDNIRLYNRNYNSYFGSEIGQNEALVISQVYYWMKLEADNSEHNKDYFVRGRWWVKNPIVTRKPDYHDWKEQFPDIGERTLKKVFAGLIRKGFLISDNINKSKIDQTLSYTIDFERLYKEFPYTKELFPMLESSPLCKPCTMENEGSAQSDNARSARTIIKNNIKNTIKNNSNREFSERKNSMYLSPTEFSDFIDDAYSEIAGTDVSQVTRLQLANIGEYFAEHYTMNYGRNVPKISKQAASKAIKNLLYSEIQVQYGVHLGTECWDLSEHSTQDVYAMIDNFFDTELEGEHSFSLFCTPEIIVRRWLEVRKNSFYRESDEELPFD